MAEYNAGKAFEEARERTEHGWLHGSRWIPIAAATLALLAAVTALLGNLRVTQSTMAKSDAIIAMTRAADTYNEYEASSIKQHIYEAVVAGGAAREPDKLRSVAKHEAAKKPPLLTKARAFEAEALRNTERSEHLLFSHEILAVATTLFEISIVLVSITALVGSRLLPIVAAVASAIGLSVAIFGLAY